MMRQGSLGLGHITRATAVAICFQFDSARTSCFRPSAVAAIRGLQPDVVLLDIHLGRTSAFEIVEEIGLDAMPLVVFVTAYDRHAVQAFEMHALDYVLKPVDPERLREAIERAASMLSLQRGASLADRV